MKPYKIFVLLMITAAILVSVAVTASAYVRICLKCQDLECKDVTYDAQNTCIALSGGCISSGECTAGLTITQ